MKKKMLYTILLITASNFLMGHASYGTDRGRTALLQSDQKIMEEAITKHEGAGKRVQKRAEARDLQKKGEQLKQDVKSVTKPLSRGGTTAAMLASASGDPHAKMAVAAFKLSLVAIDGLGKGIAQIIMGFGRYQERSQEILSNLEVLLEDLQKSIDRKTNLEKQLQALSTIEKTPESSQSSSRLKQLGKGALNAAKNAEIKVRQATDVLTNEKAKREEKIKDIQSELKIENDNYNETLRLLQIKLMQDSLKETEKKIDIEGTIATLDSNAAFYKKAIENLSKNKSKRKKQMAKIEKQQALNDKDRVYYMQFQKMPTKTPQELEKGRSELIRKIEDLTKLTKRGDTLYLQEREVQLDSEVNRSAIVALYREIDALKSQLEAVSKTAPTKAVTAPGPAKNEVVSQRRPLPPRPPIQTAGPSEEVIKKQREALRSPVGVPQR